MSYSKEELVRYRIERAKESYKDAEYLVKEERWNAAANRMYDLCRRYQISAATLYNWRKAKTEDEDETKRRLKELEAENARLKKMYAELSIDHGILKDGYELLKKWQAQDAKKK